MRLRITVVPAVLLLIVGCAPCVLKAQVPQTYSFTEDPGFPLAGPNVTKIFRDGSREVVEQTMPAGFGGREKEYRSHLLYDFQAHKLYTQVLSDPGVPCGLQDYADASAPAEFDPISGSDALQKELAGAGAVFYQFGAGKMEPGETVSFDAAGTKTVTHVITLQPSIGNDMGVYPNLVAIGADAAGNHGTPTTGANNAGFKITCTSGGGK